jgi:hypothetical protein
VPAGGVTIRTRAASGIMPPVIRGRPWVHTGLGQEGAANARLPNWSVV